MGTDKEQQSEFTRIGPRLKYSLACFAIAICIGPGLTRQASAQQTSDARAEANAGKTLYTVDIVDLTPKFVDFYNAAVQSHADPDQRWELWKEKYDFAAVPPIAAGQKMAREQLDGAWAKYPDTMSRIRKGAAGITPAPLNQLRDVGTLLGATQPVHIRLIVFVGSFLRSAFAAGHKDGVSTIAIPVEDSDQDHALDMTHEFTHAVQMQQGNWSGQSVASSIFTEGLAMHVTAQLEPGAPANIYTASTPEWQKECAARLPEVLHDLKPHLEDQGAEAVSKFIYEPGSAGLKREVYCGGWFVVGRMLNDGMSYSQLGHLSRSAAERSVAETMVQMVGPS